MSGCHKSDNDNEDDSSKEHDNTNNNDAVKFRLDDRSLCWPPIWRFITLVSCLETVLIIQLELGSLL